MAVSMQNKLEIGNLTHVTTYQAGMLQASAVRALRIFCNEVLKPYGLTKKQWLVVGLALEAGAKGIHFNEIATRLDMAPSSLTSMIARLEESKKIICKDCTEDGKRIVTIHPKFQPDCGEIEDMLRIAMRNSIYKDVTPLEFRIYLKVLFCLSNLKPGDI